MEHSGAPRRLPRDELWRERYFLCMAEEEERLESVRHRLQKRYSKFEEAKKGRELQVIDYRRVRKLAAPGKSSKGLALVLMVFSVGKAKSLMGKARTVADMAPKRFQRAPGASTSRLEPSLPSVQAPAASTSKLVSKDDPVEVSAPRLPALPPYFNLITTRVQRVASSTLETATPPPPAKRKRDPPSDGASSPPATATNSASPRFSQVPPRPAARPHGSSSALFLPKRARVR
jgi:hypothetical protein